MQSTFESMYSIPDTIVKLLVSCKMATELVESIDQASPNVDMYCFMPQLQNGSSVLRALTQSQYEDNEIIMGQNDNDKMKKKLSAHKLGSIKTVKDVVRNIVNLCIINLACEDLTGRTEDKSICYQLLQQHAAIFLRRPFKRWADKHESKHPQLPYFLARMVEVCQVTLANLTIKNFQIVSNVNAGNLEAVSLAPYTKLVRIFVNIDEKLTRLIDEDAPLRDIPITCPSEFNPDEIRQATANRRALECARVHIGGNNRNNATTDVPS